MSDKNEKLKILNDLFGTYRAEWLKGKIYQFFFEPSYFAALKGDRTCILQGGRGTGKTTALKGLSYLGQLALHNNNMENFDTVDFIGIYYRANTNHVRAFVGYNLTEDIWQKVFGHYFNLVICREIIIFLEWHKRKKNNDKELSSEACKLIGKALAIKEECDTFQKLRELSELQLYEFQAEINNISDSNIIPTLSMPGDPIRLLTEFATSLDQFKNKVFYILIDEYENFENYQQQLINTLIKHNTDRYTFKIGVRELGWRVKHTLNVEELLNDPADYALINIEEKLTEGSYFEDFAKNVCQPRLKALIDKDIENYSIEKTLMSLTIEEEALELDVTEHEYFKEFNSEYYKKYEKESDLPHLYKFFIAYWAKTHKMTVEEAITDYKLEKEEWNIRYDNYKYDTLFKLKKNKTGITKYYCGWNTYTKLANGNIRYLMELVYKAYEKHIFDDLSFDIPISAKNQTLAAQEVGRKNLMELEGLWKNGAQLTRLLMGFGKIFNVLAREESANRPEVNQFIFDKPISPESEEIITAAVMNLALVRLPGNKISGLSEIKEHMYTIHPIFAPHFVFSYRRKRKMVINEVEFIGIINNPRKYILDVLKKSEINPNQLTFDF